jgi:hypothetical protein
VSGDQAEVFFFWTKCRGVCGGVHSVPLRARAILSAVAGRDLQPFPSYLPELWHLFVSLKELNKATVSRSERGNPPRFCGSAPSVGVTPKDTGRNDELGV